MTKPKPRALPKPKKNLRKKVAAPKPKTSPVVPAVTVPEPLAPTVGASSGIPLKPSTTRNGALFFIIVIALSCAIACLGAAVVPANRLPWRPAAIFVWDRQFQLALAGLALLAAAAMTLIVGSGS